MKHLKLFNESYDRNIEIDGAYNQFLDISDSLTNLEDKGLILSHRLYFILPLKHINNSIDQLIDISSDESVKRSFESLEKKVNYRKRLKEIFKKDLKQGVDCLFYLNVRLDIKRFEDVSDKMSEIMYCVDFIKNMGYKTELIIGDNRYYIKIYFKNEIFKKV